MNRALEVVRHASAAGRWTYVFADAAPALAPAVARYCGYHEQTPGPLRRRELPGPRVVVILDLGPTLTLLEPHAAHHRHGFVCGLDDRATLTETAGAQHGIQLDLSPIAAGRLLGMPMRALAGRTVAIDDIVPGAAALCDRLRETRAWESRFDLVDDFLRTRLARAAAPPRWIAHAWQRLEASGGNLAIGALARELGVSRKHLSITFREHVGLAPKPAARLVRFGGIARALHDGAPLDWAALAAAHGYFDQAHLIREVRDFTGQSPGELAAARLADRGGVRG